LAVLFPFVTNSDADTPPIVTEETVVLAVLLEAIPTITYLLDAAAPIDVAENVYELASVALPVVVT
jgi:hypothetical protein